VISLIKFLLLAAFTVFLTVVVFRYARSPPSRRISTSLDTLAAAAALDPRDDGNRWNDKHSRQVRTGSRRRLRRGIAVKWTLRID